MNIQECWWSYIPCIYNIHETPGVLMAMIHPELSWCLMFSYIYIYIHTHTHIYIYMFIHESHDNYDRKKHWHRPTEGRAAQALSSARPKLSSPNRTCRGETWQRWSIFGVVQWRWLIMIMDIMVKSRLNSGMMTGDDSWIATQKKQWQNLEDPTATTLDCFHKVCISMIF